MRNLPAGTLTFFFSDIEGSTRLLERLGDRYSPMLERHREIVRSAFGRAGGIEVGTQGDSFFAVFPAAQDAITAAVAIQRAIGAEAWSENAALRIRVGLHTGEARVVAGDYVGLDVHRAARIMAAAHGGEIVASSATCSGLDGILAADIELRDLGEHRLRDLSAPERLFQVIAAGLMTDFPPLRTLDRTPNNLPTQPTILVGRDAELERIRRHLDSSRVRLLTLTGPGGIGKTRLALQAAANQADRVQDGVYFVDLSDVEDADGVMREIAQAIGLAVPAGSTLRSGVAAGIGQRDLLLVLDNFEQVMTAADEVADLLRQCPRLRIIVTSRESLRVRGEQLIEVAPLAFPSDEGARPTAADIAGYEAVHLFLERATEARPDFALSDDNAGVVAAICARLDGLPLAIELAAARLRLFTIDDLRDRLATGLDVLRGGARDLPQRQRTLRDTIAWSYDLLEEDERAIFELLSVFASAQIDQVEGVAAELPWLADVDVVDVLASLVDKSLLRAASVGRGQRLSMLLTIHEYAADRLDADEARSGAARDAHAAWFAALAAERAGALAGPSREAALDDLTVEVPNLLVAWRRFVDRGDLGRLNALLDVLWPLHESRGWYHGALALLNDLLRVLETLPPAPERTAKEITLRLSVARALLAISGYTDEVEGLYRKAIALAEAEGSIPRQLPVLRSLASFHLYRGEIEKTVAIGEKLLRLAAAENDELFEIEGHLIVGPAMAFLGRAEEGLAHVDRVVELYDPDRHRSARFRLGPNPGVAAAAISGLLHWQYAYPETADRRAATALELAARVQHPYSLTYGTFHVGLLDLWNERLEAARRRATEVQAIAASHDYGIWVAAGVVLEGLTIALLGDPEAGRARVESGVALYQQHPTPPVFWPQILAFRGMAAAAAGDTGGALEFFGEAAAIAAPGTGDHAFVEIQRGNVLLATGNLAAAASSLRAAIESGGGAHARALELMAATALTAIDGDAAAEGRATIGAILPTLTEGLETPLVRRAREAAGSPRAATATEALGR